MKFFKLLKNTKGVTIVQVLIAAGLTAAISLGVVQMLENTRRTQRRIQLLGVLQDLKKQIEERIRDQSAFNNSILNNTGAPYTELKAGLAVNEFAATAPVKLVLYDASGMLESAYNLLGPAETTGNGFTEKGTPCTTFNANLGSGDDRCPISYRIMLVADCPITVPAVQTSCRDPQLKIVARLVFNPSSNTASVLKNWDSMLAQTDGSDITSDVVGKYDVMIKRTASSIGRSFLINSYVTSSTTLCNVTGAMTLTNVWGAGACTSATTPAVHPTSFNFGWSKDSDPHTLVEIASATTLQRSRFRFNETGSYLCSVKAKAIDCDGFRLELYNETAGVSVGTTYTIAPSFFESEARLDINFSVGSTTDNYIIRQRCERSNANPAPVERTSTENCRLGFSSTSPTSTPFAPLSVNCSKMDAAF